MEYKELAKLYRMDASAERESNAQARLQERREAPSTFNLEFKTSCGPLFIAVPRELSTLTEAVLRKERKVSRLMADIPGIAGDEVLRGLVFEEVVSSNAIENIHSTRRQIEEAVRETKGKGTKEKRFRELARLYLDMTFGTPEVPRNPVDIRVVYDRAMDGESLEDAPDGKLFRAGEVYVGDGLRQVHAGLLPEESIIEAMEAMLQVATSEDIPGLYRALASHYIFEYTHPFYDGNGRTGRYLLSLFLEETLSKPTALSLSHSIAENKSVYYRAFEIVEDPLNGGELTFFVNTMLDLISQAQDELIVKLEDGRKRYDLIREACRRWEESGEYSPKELDIVFMLAQQAAFGFIGDVSVDRLADMLGLKAQQTRKYLGRLVERGVVVKTNARNPVMFALTGDYVERELPFLDHNAIEPSRGPKRKAEKRKIS